MTLVMPFSAGGSSDAIARIVADGISNNLRHPVVVENVTGAGGLLGGSAMSALPPKADMDQHRCDVRFVPKADIGTLTDVRFTAQSGVALVAK